MDYISLHNHTDFSNIRLLDSTNKIDKIIDRAIQLKMKGIAITDHESLSGHLKALKYIKSLREKAEEKVKKESTDDNINNLKYLKEFKIILGNEIYLVRNNLNKDNYVSNEDKYYHFLLLAKDEIGHKQLRKLSSRAWSRSYRQYIERVPTYYSDIEEIVKEDPGHLIASTACLGGFIGSKILDAGANKNRKTKIYEEIDNFIIWCKDVFKDDFYLEIQPSFTKEQIYANQRILEFGEKHNLNTIVTTDAHYLSKKDRLVHKAYLNAQDGEREVDSFYASTYLMDNYEMWEYFKEYLEEDTYTNILNNTLSIGEKIIEYDLEHGPIVPFIPVDYKSLKYVGQEDIDFFTERDVKDKYSYIYNYATSKFDQDKFLYAKIVNGLQEKYNINGVTEEMLIRIDNELKELWEISEKLGERLSAYLITVSKIIELIWNEGDSLVGPSRGSSFGFFINYLIDITQISPLHKNYELPYWRFINSSRVSLPDVDIDTQGNRRNKILKALKDYFGELNVINVCTFGLEKSKSAILTAARGLGIDSDLGLYLSSMVPSERGTLWSLHDCYYGNEEEEREPVKQFVKEMDGKFKELWEVAQNIEGLISRRGIHAAGVIISNQEITNHSALMVSPNGQLTTQYELNDSEAMGLLKFDLLSIEALDKIRATIELLSSHGYIERKATLKETYMSILNPEDRNILEYDNPKIWELAHNDKVLSLFQMETPVGGAAIKEAKPNSVTELTAINSLMRLMPAGATEMPIKTFIRYKNDINEWYKEMREFGLTEHEIEIMKKYLLTHYGIAESQESMMLLVMDKEISNFSVAEADKLRKAVAKKAPKDFDKIQALFYKKGTENGASSKILEYVWQKQILRQRGYSFSQLHAFSYSVIALQELNLAYKYPIIFWNTANLIVDSAGEEEEEDEIIRLSNIDVEEDNETEEDDRETDRDADSNDREAIKKKKNKTVDYGKISFAIGKMQQRGVRISLPDINLSDYTFVPNVEEDRIIYGIKGITRVGDNLVKEIIDNRPYLNLLDFLSKVKVNKLQAINLIKAGVFDNLEKISRKKIMDNYLLEVADVKKDCNLRNMQMLINQNLIPEEYDYYRRLFNFNRYLKKFKEEENYILDEVALNFYSNNYDIDLLDIVNNGTIIKQKVWDKIYTKDMNPMRNFLKENKQEMLLKMNGNIIDELRDKYAVGTISKWEMDSLGFYYNEHELKNIDFKKYDIKNFFEEPEDPIVENVFFPTKGRSIPVPIFKLYRICGTVINKDKAKHIITLLTPEGVVNIKIWQAQFTKYDKQISEKLESGKKKILERSWFSRGNKLLVTGFRRGNDFVPKIYARSKYDHPFELITKINDDGTIETVEGRGEI